MIDVLLASFRPDASMLAAQVDSIRAQKGVELRLSVREDHVGEGACANFAKLLEQSAGDYVAFSDQDDVWLPDKLERSMAAMRELEARYGKDVPLLVFTDAKVVDRELNVIDDSLFHRTCLDPERRSPRQLIMQNVANGNTMLFNAALREKALPIPSDAFMHDHWVALVASVYGHMAYVNMPTLLYRQHSSNVIGAKRVSLAKSIRNGFGGVSAMRRKQLACIRQAAAFARQYGESVPECFRAVVNFSSRLRLVRRWILLRYGMFKYGWWRNLGLWCII
jgi:glycosyltransferase involved in cell wall biosynthesis